MEWEGGGGIRENIKGASKWAPTGLKLSHNIVNDEHI